METKDLIEFLQDKLDSSYEYIQRFVFIEINTNLLCENGFPITVFLTNNLPDCIIVSDSGWINENKYGDFSKLFLEARRVYENRWGIVPYSDETFSLYHTITCHHLTDLPKAIKDMIQFIKELSVNMEVRRLNL